MAKSYSEIRVLCKAGIDIASLTAAQGGRGTRDWSLEEWLEQSCQKCGSPSDIDLLICEAGNGCTRCYHTVCVGLEGIPKGKWHCPECTIKQEDV